MFFLNKITKNLNHRYKPSHALIYKIVFVLALTIYECNEFWDFRSPKCQNNTENNDGLNNENKSKFGVTKYTNYKLNDKILN